MRPNQSRLQSAIKRGSLWRFADFKRGKWRFPSPTHSKQCCVAVHDTCNRPHLWLGERGRGADCFVLWNDPFEDSVSTILSPIVGHVAAARKRSHQRCLTMTPNNTETIERMTCHCFLRPIKRDLTSSSYTTADCCCTPFLARWLNHRCDWFIWSLECVVIGQTYSFCCDWQVWREIAAIFTTFVCSGKIRITSQWDFRFFFSGHLNWKKVI